MSNSSRNIEMITKITLENYPSRNEVLTLLDVFLSDNNYPKDYSVSNKDSMLVILFKKPVTIKNKNNFLFFRKLLLIS